MATVAHHSAALDGMREKGLPAGVKQQIFHSGSFFLPQIRIVKNELRTYRTDFAPGIDSKGRFVLALKIAAFDITLTLVFLHRKIISFFAVAVYSDIEGTVFLRGPG